MVAEKVNRKDNRVLQVKISEELKARFDAAIKKNSINKSALIRGWIEKWLSENE